MSIKPGKDQMKILRIIRSVNPEGGGPIEGVKQLSDIMQSQGHSTEIVSLDAPDAPYVLHSPFTVHAMGPGKGTYGYSSKLKPWLLAHVQLRCVYH